MAVHSPLQYSYEHFKLGCSMTLCWPTLGHPNYLALKPASPLPAAQAAGRAGAMCAVHARAGQRAGVTSLLAVVLYMYVPRRVPAAAWPVLVAALTGCIAANQGGYSDALVPVDIVDLE